MLTLPPQIQITAYMRQRDEQEARATVQLEEKLKRRWAKAEEQLQAFYALDADEKASKSHYQSLQKIIKRVDDVREELMLMQRRREAKREQQEQQSVEAEVPQQPTVSAPEEASQEDASYSHPQTITSTTPIHYALFGKSADISGPVSLQASAAQLPVAKD